MRISSNNLRDLFNRLNRMDLRKADYLQICRIVEQIFQDSELQLFHREQMFNIFRIRRSQQKILRVEDVHAPPPEKVIGFQRCNPPGVPMFYASLRRIGAIRESRVQIGEICYLSQWSILGQFAINLFFQHSSGPESLVPGDLCLIGRNSDMISTYIDRVFNTKIHETFSEQYKLTSAIAQNFTSNFLPQHGVAQDGYACLLYTSVLDSKSYNLAMHAPFARDRLRLDHVAEIEIIDVTDDAVKIGFLDTAIDFDDGKIQWTGSARYIPKLKTAEGHVTIMKHRGGWAYGMTAEEVNDNYIEKLLHE